MQDIIQMCSFEGTKSTKGASKMRRDLINSEITALRDLLPLPPSTRQRLSQLQLMALVCVYVRKSNYFQQVLQQHEKINAEISNIGFSKALSGFIIMMTQGGKLLFISENAAEYLGHSMEDLLIHGDSFYDIIDKQDHSAVQSELIRGSQSAQNSSSTDEERFFLCRINVSRNARRQLRFGDQKVVLVQGHYMSYLPLCSRNEPVFVAHCTPVAMPETRESVVQGSTNVFTSVHTLDMKFISIDENGEFYLGYNAKRLVGSSWYQLVHPDNLRDVQAKHKLITSSDQDRSCIMLLRLQSSSGSWQWIHCVLQVKDSNEISLSTPAAPASPQTPLPSQQSTPVPQTSQTTQQPVIVVTNQVLTEKEAKVLKTNAWLYQYFAVPAKIQYGVTGEPQRIHPTYYPQMMQYQMDPTHYMNSTLNPVVSNTHQMNRGATSSYTLPATSPYLQHYHHPYSVRLHHGYDYRDHSWSHYTAGTMGEYPYTHFYQQNASNQQPNVQKPVEGHRRSPRRTPPTKSPRRSPLTPQSLDASPSSNTSVVVPVAVRPSTSTASQAKTSSSDVEDMDNISWKSSPIQEVPEFYDYPFITPPYSATPTKAGSFNFESVEPKDAFFKDQRLVPNLDYSDSRWTDPSLRSPWLPPDEITTPLRVLNHL